LLLSTGLKARLIAISGERVNYTTTGGTSPIDFHRFPDFGATYVDTREGNEGGWIYVSNSEVRKPKNQGGVGALTFDKHGQVVAYRMVLENTTSNCGGGRTPWESWISCEEFTHGVNWEVDPTGERDPRPITLGRDGGLFESFAYDIRFSHYFVTEDHEFGPLRRFIPADRSNSDPWEELHGDGETTFLRLLPNSDQEGNYEWINNKELAGLNANAFYRNAEGIDVYENELFFISKVLKTMFILNLDNGTYTSHSTRQGVFDGQPDQIQRIIGGASDDLLYFTEDGGKDAGVHARNRQNEFFTILESDYYQEETSGLAFSPDAMHMYVAYQLNGTLFDITREDGLPFNGKTLAIRYHATNAE
jgi:secreted PhoX family phosphatase